MASLAQQLPVQGGRPLSHPHHRILVVDDFDATREAIATMLQMKGFEVHTASSGREALALLGTGFRPCAMLLDLRMPDLDGWTVWDRMRERPDLALTPVVILSADPVDVRRARSVGIREFVRKPIDAGRLATTLARHCEWLRPVFQ